MKKQNQQNNVGGSFEGILVRHDTTVPKSKKQENKGITLIALVITIIVLLILAGITINLTLGENGIITRAQEAGRNYTNAANHENMLLAEFENTADQIIANVTSGGNAGTSTPTIDEKVLALKAGDYIKYDSGANGIIMCRVLYPATSEYGLQIISDKNVKNVTLGSSTYSEAVTLYNNAIETLNNDAEVYINSEYAQDARCVGSLPTVDSSGNFTQKDNGATTYVIPQFTNASYINSLDEDENYTTDQAQMETAGLWITGEYYWLASRHVVSYSSGCNFLVRCVHAGGSLESDALCIIRSDGTTSGYPNKRGFRPCMSLKTDAIKITSGDGTSADTAYVIGK